MALIYREHVMGQLIYDDLSGVTYLDLASLDGRVPVLFPFWDGQLWNLWLPTGDGRYMRLHPLDAGATEYVAKQGARSTDLWIPFVDFMWQYAAWPSTHGLIGSVTRDFHNLFTSVAKIDHAFFNRKALGLGGSDFVNTEVEYLLVVARRLFDNLHRVIATVWHKHVLLHNPESRARKKGRQPKDSFTKTVFKERKVPRTQEELVTEFGFSEALAAAYEKATPFFESILRLRDAIVHGPMSHGPLGLIFGSDDGWCIDRNFPEVAKFDIWTEAHRKNDNLLSLRPLLAHLVIGTIGACNEMARGLARQVDFLKPMAPGCRIYVRGPFDHAIVRLKSVFEGGDPWWSDEENVGPFVPTAPGAPSQPAAPAKG
jgi:hypothetical protein